MSGIKVSVRPASRDDLVKRFGNPASVMNPLVDYPSLVSQLKLMVLDVAIESPEYAVELVTRQTTLTFEGSKPGFFSSAESKALDEAALQEAWKTYIDGTTQMPEMMLKTRKALPGNLTAKPGTAASGYLVFLDRFPKSGTAVLSLALKASNGDTGVIPLRITFSAPGDAPTGIFARPEAKPQGNSGIFSEVK